MKQENYYEVPKSRLQAVKIYCTLRLPFYKILEYDPVRAHKCVQKDVSGVL